MSGTNAAAESAIHLDSLAVAAPSCEGKDALHPPAARSSPLFDALVAVALGGALLAGGWLDVRAYLRTHDRPKPAFQFLNTPTGERLGLDEFFHETTTVVHLGNLGRLEWEDPRDDRTRFRQALGPVSTLEIWSSLRRARIEFRFRNPVADQTLTVSCNGRVLEEIHLSAGEEIARRYPVDLRPGANRFTLGFARYRSHGIDLDSADPRPFAGRLTAFDLYLPSSDDTF